MAVKKKRKPLDAHTLRCAAAYVSARSWNDGGIGPGFRSGMKSAARMLRALAKMHENTKTGAKP